MSRVLVVDDEAGMRDFLTLFLEGEGFEVTTAADGREALRIFDERPADLVISDIRMPKILLSTVDNGRAVLPHVSG